MPTRKTSHRHNPTHIYPDDTSYFVTGAVLYHARLLALATYKQYLQEQLLKLAPTYGLDLKAWVILNNHYHVLFYLENGENLSGFLCSASMLKLLQTSTNGTTNLAGRFGGITGIGVSVTKGIFGDILTTFITAPSSTVMFNICGIGPTLVYSPTWRMKAMNGWMIAGGVIQFENFRLRMMISNTYRVIVSN